MTEFEIRIPRVSVAISEAELLERYGQPDLEELFFYLVEHARDPGEAARSL